MGGPTFACPDVLQPDQLEEPTNAKTASPADPWEAEHPSGPTHLHLPTAHVSSEDSHILSAQRERNLSGECKCPTWSD